MMLIASVGPVAFQGLRAMELCRGPQGGAMHCFESNASWCFHYFRNYSDQDELSTYTWCPAQASSDDFDNVIDKLATIINYRENSAFNIP